MGVFSRMFDRYLACTKNGLITTLLVCGLWAVRPLCAYAQGVENEPVDSRLCAFIDSGDSVILVNQTQKYYHETQRSKRRQVDELLQMIMQQPGQLKFGGVATVSAQKELNHSGSYWGVGSFDILAFTHFGKQSLLFFDFESVGGNGPDAVISNVSVLNGDAGSTVSSDGVDRLTVREAWAEFSFLGEDLTLTVGKIDLTNYFDNNEYANDENSQFLSGVFVNNPVMPVYFNSPGAVMRARFTDQFYLLYARAMAYREEEDLSKNHIQIVEGDVHLFHENPWVTHIRLLAFEHPQADGSWGWALSYDQKLGEKLGVFARYGRNANELAAVHGVEKAWSAGVACFPVIAENEYLLGAGYASTFQFGKNKAEKALELYAGRQLSDWMQLSAHLQWIKPTPSEKEHLLFGFRMNFSY